jgi:uncharacterized membrane protein
VGADRRGDRLRGVGDADDREDRDAEEPGYVPTCSINPVLSCGSVMVTHQASIFGFPNPLMGIAGFAVVIVTGVLAVRCRLPQWYWSGC